MQGDGNLVIYTAAGKAVWASETSGKDGKYAIMQGDGNLVIYTAAGKAVWASETSGKGSTSMITYTSCDQAKDKLTNSQLQAGSSLCSDNKKYLLTMQGDGNLVIYIRESNATWASETSGKFFRSNLSL